MSLTARVLLALVAAAVGGLLLAMWDPALAIRAADLVQPVGRLWLSALQMTVVPLVAALVVIGVNTASNAAASGRTARKAMIVFVVLLTAAAAFTAIASTFLLSLLPRDPQLAERLHATGAAAAGAPASLSDWIASIVPSNAIAAAAQSAMLPLVVFALFFGFAMTRVDAERRARMIDLLQTVADAMIVIVRWVLWAAPLGVFALVFAVCARVGLSMISALGYYIALQCVIYFAVTLLMYPVAAFFGGAHLRRFAAAILPAQVVAASTQSSLASLPAMIESARSRLGYPLSVTSLALPMAVSLFRINSPVQYISVAAFLAWVFGTDLSVAQWTVAIALSVVISMGSVGLPGQASFMATNMPVTQSMGLPVEPLGILLAVDTIPDVFATLGNVTADLAATSVVAKDAPADAAPESPVEPA